MGCWSLVIGRWLLVMGCWSVFNWTYSRLCFDTKLKFCSHDDFLNEENRDSDIS